MAFTLTHVQDLAMTSSTTITPTSLSTLNTKHLLNLDYTSSPTFALTPTSSTTLAQNSSPNPGLRHFSTFSLTSSITLALSSSCTFSTTSSPGLTTI